MTVNPQFMKLMTFILLLFVALTVSVFTGRSEIRLVFEKATVGIAGPLNG